MKKRITISFIFYIGISIATVTAHEEPAKTIREKEEKENEISRIRDLRIKTSVGWKHRVHDGKVLDHKYRYLVTEFSNLGSMVSITLYDTQNVVLENVQYRYDNQMNMILDADYDLDGDEVERIEYAYDDQGRVTGSQNFKGLDLDSRFEYIINREIKAVQFYKYLSNDELDYRIDYKYDSDPDFGNLVEIYKFIPGKDTVMSVKYFYDSSDRVLEKQVYTENGKLMHKFIYNYDSNGYRKEIKKILPGEIIDFVQHFNYDNNGNCLNILVLKADGTPTSKINYEYIYY